MAAVGVRCSLSLPTATRAMSWTVGLWLVAWPVVGFIAISVIAAVFLACVSIFGLANVLRADRPEHGTLVPDELQPPVGQSRPTDGAVLLTILVVGDTSLRFDRIAGRMAGGTLATTVDAMVHGTTRQAVFLPDARPAKKAKKANKLAELSERRRGAGGPSCLTGIERRSDVGAHGIAFLDRPPAGQGLASGPLSVPDSAAA